MFTWQDERWHWADVPIHAGSMWGLVLPEGTLTVRIETAKRGEVLVGHFLHMGAECCVHISPFNDTLAPLL